MMNGKLAKQICQAAARPILEQLEETAWEQVGHFCVERCGRPDANDFCDAAKRVHKKIVALLFGEYASQN